MQDFKKLLVWQKAHALTLQVYEATAHFPDDERFGLTSQLRRSCSSIPTNIAEGCGCDSSADFLCFLHIAMGSASECEYQLILTRDLGYLTSENYVRIEDQLVEVRKMLNSFIQRVRQN